METRALGRAMEPDGAARGPMTSAPEELGNLAESALHERRKNKLAIHTSFTYHRAAHSSGGPGLSFDPLLFLSWAFSGSVPFYGPPGWHHHWPLGGRP